MGVIAVADAYAARFGVNEKRLGEPDVGIGFIPQEPNEAVRDAVVPDVDVLAEVHGNSFRANQPVSDRA